MTEEKIFKRRDFGKIVVAGGLVSVLGCGGGGGKKNKPPVIESVVRDFKNEKGEYDGEAHYNIVARDPDGEIDEICAKWNDEDSHCYLGPPVAEFSRRMREGMNTLEVIAYDNKGRASSTARDGFEVPSHGEAYRHIRKMITEDIRPLVSIQLKDASSPDELKYDEFPGKVVFALDDLLVPSDFIIVMNSPYVERSILVNYVGDGEDLERGISYHNALHDYRINHLYFFATPLDEVHKAMSEFIQKYYTTDFKE